MEIQSPKSLQMVVLNSPSSIGMNVIARSERFPARDKALGRESTVEEVAWLKENPYGL